MPNYSGTYTGLDALVYPKMEEQGKYEANGAIEGYANESTREFMFTFKGSTKPTINPGEGKIKRSTDGNSYSGTFKAAGTSSADTQQNMSGNKGTFAANKK